MMNKVEILKRVGKTALMFAVGVAFSLGSSYCNDGVAASIKEAFGHKEETPEEEEKEED